MSGFAVEPDELRGLARRLVDAADDVTVLAKHPDGFVEPVRGELFGALARFRAAAEHATGVLHADVGKTEQRLVDTVRAYERADVFRA